jgi:hypothetical protein
VFNIQNDPEELENIRAVSVMKREPEWSLTGMSGNCSNEPNFSSQRGVVYGRLDGPKGKTDGGHGERQANN